MMKLSDLNIDMSQKKSVGAVVKKWMDGKNHSMTQKRHDELVGEFYSFIKRLREGEKRIYEIEKKRREETATEQELELHTKLMNWYQALLMLVSFMYHYLSVYLSEKQYYRLSVDLFGE